MSTDPTASEAAELAAWVRAYVAGASSEENLEEFVEHVNGRILAEIPELAGDAVLVAELHASTKRQFQVFLSLLEREEQELLLPPQAVDLALSIARRNLELGVLLKVYRVASEAVWDFFREVAASVPPDGPDRTAVLVYLWDHGGAWINQASEHLVGVFYAERESSLHGAFAQRGETVRAILRGDQVAIDDASRLLTYPLGGAHLALVLWTPTETADDLVALTAAADAMATTVGARLLTLPAGRGEIWTWVATRRPLTDERLRAALAEVREGAESGVSISAGTPGTGLAAFRSSHREAVDAQRHAIETETATGTTTLYADVELACVAAGRKAAVAALIQRELGALADATPLVERLRETVAAYLRRGGSVELAATDLFVHKNTVRYRLAQAEELLGHPLTERRTEVALALACLPRFGHLPAL